MSKLQDILDRPIPKAYTFETRRDFLIGGAAAVGAAWLGVLVQSRLFPRASTAEAKPVTLPLAELPVGDARQIDYGGSPVMVIRTAESIKAYSLICTHLGCTVYRVATGFQCPCHGSQYDNEAEVVGGPAPTGLPWLPIRTVPGGQIEIDSGASVPKNSFYAVA